MVEIPLGTGSAAPDKERRQAARKDSVDKRIPCYVALDFDVPAKKIVHSSLATGIIVYVYDFCSIEITLSTASAATSAAPTTATARTSVVAAAGPEDDLVKEMTHDLKTNFNKIAPFCKEGMRKAAQMVIADNRKKLCYVALDFDTETKKAIGTEVVDNGRTTGSVVYEYGSTLTKSAPMTYAAPTIVNTNGPEPHAALVQAVTKSAPVRYAPQVGFSKTRLSGDRDPETGRTKVGIPAHGAFFGNDPIGGAVSPTRTSPDSEGGMGLGTPPSGGPGPTAKSGEREQAGLAKPDSTTSRRHPIEGDTPHCLGTGAS